QAGHQGATCEIDGARALRSQRPVRDLLDEPILHQDVVAFEQFTAQRVEQGGVAEQDGGHGGGRHRQGGHRVSSRRRLRDGAAPVPGYMILTSLSGGKMDLQLHGKHVLITGGSKGIGLACAQAFLAEGARVSLVSRSAENLKLGAQHLSRFLAGEGTADAPSRVATFAADLKDANAAVAALDAAEKAGGPVDILVNSAGAAKRVGPDDLTPQAWHDSMDAKYFTYIHMLDPVVKRMGKRGSGVIVNVIGAGGKVASPTHLSGGAANAALMLVSAGMAAAYGPKGVRVNAVNPGL